MVMEIYKIFTHVTEIKLCVFIKLSLDKQHIFFVLLIQLMDRKIKFYKTIFISTNTFTLNGYGMIYMTDTIYIFETTMQFIYDTHYTTL